MHSSQVRALGHRPAWSLTTGVLAFLVGVQTFRILAITVAGEALGTGSGAAWFFPAVADFCFGCTAPLVAYALWRSQRVLVWVIGLIWVCLSLFDFVDGLVTSIAIGPPPGTGTESSDAILFSIGWIVIDLVALAILAALGRQVSDGRRGAWQQP